MIRSALTNLLFLSVAVAMAVGAPNLSPSGAKARPESPAVRPAPDPTDDLRPAIRTLTDRNNLPQNFAKALALDARGQLWVGTEHGASVYNGHSWTTILLPEAAGESDINHILPTSDGSLWFALRSHGACVLKNGEWRVFGKGSGLPSTEILAAAETVDATNGSHIWFGTSKGLLRFDGDYWTMVPLWPGNTDPVVTCLAATPDGLLVGAADGLGRLEGDAWSRPDDLAAYPGGRVSALCYRQDENGQTVLSVGGADGRLARLERGVWTMHDVRFDLPDNEVTSIAETTLASGAHTLWVGTRGGLARFRDNHWTRFDARSGLPNPWVAALLVSDPDTLWVGTVGGLTRVKDGRWRVLDASNGLPTDSVLSLLEVPEADGTFTVWVGTDGGGLARWSRGAWSVFDTRSGLPDNVVWSLRRSLDGKSVFAGTSDGVVRFDGSGWTRYGAQNHPRSSVFALLESTDKTGASVLWAGTEDGLFRCVDGVWTNIGREWGIPDGVVWEVDRTVDDNGADVFWIGTDNGLARVADGQTRVFDSSSGVPFDIIGNVRESRMEDGTRLLWVGTYGGGVARLDLATGETTPFTKKTMPGLISETIYQLQEDARHRLYLSTDRGILRLSPRGPSPRGPEDYTVESFTADDGVPGNEGNGGAGMVDHLGRIWLGTIAGVAVLDPALEWTDRASKPLAIERATLKGNRPVAPDAVLRYFENTLTFEYALTSFHREEDTRYQTQLVGLEDEPTDWSADAKREFTALPAGTYTFTVWGRDYAGNVSGPAKATFSISAAPWRTWWAYTLYALAIAALAYAGVRWRVQTLKRQTRLLEEKVAARTAELADSERRAIEASRAKSVFLANMSHELRTPLNAIIGFVQLLDRDPRLVVDQRESLDVISRSGEHLLALINDVLSVSKIEAGRVTLNETAFDLKLFLQSIEELFRLPAQSKGLHLLVDVDPDVPRYVFGDEGKLRQVTINLLGNALKFTESGGVALRAAWVDGRARFEVEDTGAGIAPEEIDFMFGAFAQTETGRTAKEGTGLGLFISQSFIRLMGGEIRVRSTRGEGTVFSFDVSLPETEAPAPVAETRRVARLAPGQSSRRILVVDDNAANRLLLRRLLQDVGFEVREAANGVEALDAWVEWRPDMIWLDLRMPIMDGHEVMRTIRTSELEHPETARTVIAALTASAFEQDRDSILASGFDEYVAKPFREATIFEKMASLLGVEYVHEVESAHQNAASDAGGASLAERLAAFSSDLRNKLLQTLVRGDVAAASAVADEIAAEDESLASALKSLIRQYRFDEILDAIE